MPKRKFVLTTVGISILLNSADSEDWRRRLIQLSNATTVEGEIATRVEAQSLRVLEILRQIDIRKNRDLSAELNGLYGYYDDQLSQAQTDVHWLVATDTYLGRQAAKVVETFLREQGLNCNVHTPPNLSTLEPRTFSVGIKNLIHWCEETIPEYRKAQYHVAFNLTGAFKSLQGYLNIAGMFYADEMVYIFETGQRLLSIPRLPLQIDTEVLRDYRVELALMAQGRIYPEEQVGGIPAGMLDVDQKGNALLSDWGTIVWNRARQTLLGDDLLSFPRLQYTDSFRRDFKSASSTERAELQEKLAKVSALLEDHNGNTSALKQDGGLQYNIFANQKSKDGRPIGHFRISDSRRVSCTAEDGALRLRRYGEHSINDNP
jgi:putative CRISPR-associated protein (TIGR02619 family)